MLEYNSDALDLMASDQLVVILEVITNNKSMPDDRIVGCSLLLWPVTARPSSLGHGLVPTNIP